MMVRGSLSADGAWLLQKPKGEEISTTLISAPQKHHLSEGATVCALYMRICVGGCEREITLISH